MYEARLLAKIGLQFPSIFDIDPEDALGNLPEKHLTLKTWSLLLSHDINTTPLTFLLLKMECQKVLVLIRTNPCNCRTSL
ncbi:unnamed protein product [Penicillium roqueforti FM164]|uniref:Genomic scaffold, ProqFM164S03 n=1 Tax=Penicillium roqueforti (strain FM164) TaxID=1365484 RepID=W6QE48_PENRF|nr:unnamed protein product [Penicillium roqueforti FM164]